MASVEAGKHIFMVSVVGLFRVSVVAGNVFLFMVSVVGFLMVSGCYRTAAVSPMENVKKTPGRFRDELSIYAYMYICIYVYLHICICMYMYVHVCVCMYMYVYVCICMYVYIYISLSLYIYIYISLSLYIYIYICNSSLLPPHRPASRFKSWNVQPSQGRISLVRLEKLELTNLSSMRVSNHIIPYHPPFRTYQAAPNVRLRRTYHCCARGARRENPQCLAKSSPYAGPSAGTEVAKYCEGSIWPIRVYRHRNYVMPRPW